MALVLRSVNGKRLTKIMAYTPEAQRAVDEKAIMFGVKAERELMGHRETGNSSISIEKGKTDAYVIMSDRSTSKVNTKGRANLNTALSIEYGRKKKTLEDDGVEQSYMEGLFILHKAFNLRDFRKPTGTGGGIE